MGNVTGLKGGRQVSPGALRAARLAAGLRPEQVAFQIGRSVYAVHEYERGRAIPPVAVLAAISDVLACPIEQLLTDGLG